MESHRKLIDGSRKEWIETSQNSGSGGRSLLVPQGMSKIRINELARELEVKPSIILDMLPELGVMDKKTHSSSLDDDVALQLRRRVAAGAFAEPSDHGSDESESTRASDAEHRPAAREAAPVEAQAPPV